MSRNMKIVLGVVGGILVVCCLGALLLLFFAPRMLGNFLEESVVDDPAEAAEIGTSIVDYTLPSGFAEEGAMSLFGIDMVFIASESDADTIVMLMEFPAALAGNEAEMQRQMEDAFDRQFGQGNVNLMFDRAEDIVVNGAGTTMDVYEGKSEDGTNVRQGLAVFETKSGDPGMFMIYAPISEWDARGLDEFIDSME